jgi:hypothetical protein
MSTGFDVYHKWLSIPPSEQPPNHYRLLGLGLFESDPDVIAAAADRQMSHVQTYKNGPRAELSQKLLNEIATAKLCLLKPLKKEAYDERLRQRLAETQPAAASVSAPMLAAHPGVPMGAASGGGATTNAGGTGVAPNPLPPPPIAAPPRIDLLDDEAHRTPWGTTAVLVAGAVLILLLIVAIWAVLKFGRGGDSSGQANSPTTSSSSDAGVQPNPAAATSSVSKSGEPTVSPASAPTPTAAPSNKTDPNLAPPTDPTTNVKPAVLAPNRTVKPSVVEPNAKPTTDPAAAKPPDNAAKKLLVPDKAALAAAEARFPDAFADTTPQAVLEKAKTLDIGPLVYVALNHALDGAIAGGDVPLVGQILDELSRRFTIDSLSLRAKSYLDLRQHVTSAPAWEILSESTLALIDDATAAGHSDLAAPLVETSLQAARKANNVELIRKATLKVLSLQAEGPGVGGRGSEVGR